jgi:hypothetical protein
MNIVYIIGNGFDLNLGMKTRYTDFYEYYKLIKSDKSSIKQLKNEILNNYQTWSDLELAIGNYTQKLNSTEEFDEVFEDILDKLSEYLEKEENSFDLNVIDKQLFYHYLSYPEKYLLKADEIKIKNFKELEYKGNWKIDIITLNYTRIIDNLIDFKSQSINIGNINNQYNIYLRSLQHLHGYLDDRMIMGVNDISQIKNSEFHKNDDVLNALIKSNCNKVSKHTIDDLCKSQIQSANLICIFGSSIGDTDNIWWEIIGEQLKKGSKLIIFEKGENISKKLEYKKDRRVQKIKKVFLSKTKLSETEKIDIIQNIYVGVNTDMFKLV